MLRFLSIVWFLSSNFADGIENTSLIKTKHIQPQTMENYFFYHILKWSFNFLSDCLSSTIYLTFVYKITAPNIYCNIIELIKSILIHLHWLISIKMIWNQNQCVLEHWYLDFWFLPKQRQVNGMLKIIFLYDSFLGLLKNVIAI